MPRAPSDLVAVMFSVRPSTLEGLDLIASHRGLLTTAGPNKGEPNRSEALRELVAREARRIGRARARKGAGP
jgi:hypothetical protein